MDGWMAGLAEGMLGRPAVYTPRWSAGQSVRHELAVL